MSILKRIESHFGKQIHKLDANDVDELEKIQQWDRIRTKVTQSYQDEKFIRWTNSQFFSTLKFDEQ